METVCGDLKSFGFTEVTQLISNVVELELGSSDLKSHLNYAFASVIQQEMPSSCLVSHQDPKFVPVTIMLWNCSLVSKMRIIGLGEIGLTGEGCLDSAF